MSVLVSIWEGNRDWLLSCRRFGRRALGERGAASGDGRTALLDNIGHLLFYNYHYLNDMLCKGLCLIWKGSRPFVVFTKKTIV